MPSLGHPALAFSPVERKEDVLHQGQAVPPPAKRSPLRSTGTTATVALPDNIVV
jgi:hypothetical protein